MRQRTLQVVSVAVLILAARVGIGQPELSVAELIAKLLDAPKFGAPSQQIVALGKFGAKAVQPLAEHLNHPNPRARLNVVMALAATGAREALPHLIYAFEDSDQQVRRKAGEAIGRCGEEGFKAALLLLQDPDEQLRNEADEWLLASFRQLFPFKEVPVEEIDPLAAQVDGGLVIGLQGPVVKPYTVRATIEQKDKLFYKVMVNELTVEAYDRPPEQVERLKQEGERQVRDIVRRLSRGGFLFVGPAHHRTGGESAAMFEYAVGFVRDSGKSEFEKAKWLMGLPWFRLGRYPLAALAALGYNADPAKVEALARRLEEEAPRFNLFVREDGIRLDARGVGIDSCIRKFQRRLNVSIRAEAGLQPPPDWIFIREFLPLDTFLLAFADRIAAKLTKEGDAYKISPLEISKPPKPEPWELVWQKAGPWPWLRPPVVADGKVILMMEHGSFVALSLRDGAEAWQTRLAYSPEAPIVVGETLYIGGGDNDMHAVLVKDGKKLWDYQAFTPTEGSVRLNHDVTPIGACGEAALFASTDENVYAIDRQKGTELWKYKRPARGPCWVDEGILYYAGGGTTTALNVVTRRVLWNTPVKITRPGFLLKHEDRILVSGGGVVLAMSVKDGMALWQRDTGRLGSMDAPMHVLGNRLLVPGGSDDNNVYGLDVRSGEILWQTNVPGFPFRAALHGERRLIFTLNSGRLYTLDAVTGNPLEDRPMDVTVHGGPVVIGDMILVPTRDRQAEGRYGRGVLSAYRPGLERN